jgi:VCBS repeat-containing protein
MAMQPRHLVRTTLAVAAALLVAGCGGDGNGNGETVEPESASETIQVSATEFAFDPASVTIDAPGTYTFVVRNDGQAPHALAIEGPGVDEETATIEGGETAEVTVEITEAGEYRILCPVGDHAEQGMEGTVVVEGG